MSRAFDAWGARLSRVSPAPVVVAFSGGSDSTALLHRATQWGRAQGRAVLAVTIDHRLQAGSDAWTRRAAAVAAALGAGFRALTWEGDKPVTGLPAAARQARHRLLAQAAREAGASVILLGHTQDDLMEAQAMRLEGSSVGSPAEWSPSPVWPQGRGLFHFRPLLNARRADLRDGLRSAGIDWLEDPANADLSYARARARAGLAGRPAQRPDEAAVIDLSGLAGVCEATPWGGLRIERDALTEGPSGVARRFVQAAVACASGAERPAAADRVEGLLNRLKGAEDVVASLGGARIEANGAVMLAREAGERRRGGLAPMTLEPGVGAVWDGRFELRASTGMTIGPLAGQTRRLDAVEQRRLAEAPAMARGALPVVFLASGMVTCPLLAGGSGLECRPLIGDRLLAACGVIAREAD